MTEKTPEQKKFEEFYLPDADLPEYEPEEEGCDYDFADECVEPSLRNMGNCFECWLFQEADTNDREQAKEAKP